MGSILASTDAVKYEGRQMNKILPKNNNKKTWKIILMSVCLECDFGIGGGPAAGAAGIQGEGADPGANHQHPLLQHIHQRHRLQRLLILIQVRDYPPFPLES